ncbi:MAG: glycosyltransferase [bacterium]
MKILYIAHKFWEPNTEGTLNYYSSLFSEVKKYHSIQILIPIKKQLIDRFAETKNIILMPISYTVNPDARFPIYHSNSLFNRKFEHKFRLTIEQYQPEIIHFQHLLGFPFSLIEIANKSNIPVLITIHDFWTICPRIHLYDANEQICRDPQNGLICFTCVKKKMRMNVNLKNLPRDIFFSKDRRKNFFVKRYNYVVSLLKQINRIIVPSRFVKDVYSQIGIDTKKISVLPHGLNLSDSKKEAKNQNEKMIFGYVGGIHKHKGIHDLIKAFTAVNQKRAELVIYGEGNLRWLKGYIPQTELSYVKVKGLFDASEKAKIYQSMDYVIIPSRCYETFSFVIREAFHYGVPAIAPDHSVFLEIIKDGQNGFLFHQLNWHSLADVLNNVISRKIKISSRNIKTTTPTLKEHIDNLFAIYESLLNKNERVINNTG